MIDLLAKLIKNLMNMKILSVISDFININDLRTKIVEVNNSSIKIQSIKIYFNIIMLYLLKNFDL